MVLALVSKGESMRVLVLVGKKELVQLLASIGESVCWCWRW